MNISRTINYVFILIGGGTALYAQAGAEQNKYLLIGGVIILIVGIYRTSRNIPSKYDEDAEELMQNKSFDNEN
ncbi:hypothetical protein [uncultured Winogradskyella sp.]|uniref:hypothetical protein n=1 Tax=uncultured Winogradskyella sp. TaxID=395353 RepID=UPI002607EC96|nr:hypothetical protein [uncultured Winogradskyella sp.]